VDSGHCFGRNNLAQCFPTCVRRHRERGNSVPRLNVGSQQFSKGSFNEVVNTHWKRLIFYISTAHFYRYIRYENIFQSVANL